MELPLEDAAALERHCLPFIRGTAAPERAVELMASRYVAYTLCEVDYLVATGDPAAVASVDREAIEQWSRSAQWLGLEILETVAGEPHDTEGVVEFIARYTVDGREEAHHERSTFKRIEGRWHFIEGRAGTK